MQVFIADDVSFQIDEGLGAFRMAVVTRGEIVAEIIGSRAVIQMGVHRAIEAIQSQDGRSANVVAFPCPQPDHADTA